MNKHISLYLVVFISLGSFTSISNSEKFLSDSWQSNIPVRAFDLNKVSSKLIEEGNYKDAIIKLNTVIHLKDDYYAALFNLALSHALIGSNMKEPSELQRKKAWSIFKIAEKIANKYLYRDARIYDAMGWLGLMDIILMTPKNSILAKDKYREIEMYLKKSIEINGGLSSPHNNLGVLYELMGEIEKAIKYYEKASELNNNQAKKSYIRLSSIVKYRKRSYKNNLDLYHGKSNSTASTKCETETVLQRTNKQIVSKNVNAAIILLNTNTNIGKEEHDNGAVGYLIDAQNGYVLTSTHIVQNKRGNIIKDIKATSQLMPHINLSLSIIDYTNQDNGNIALLKLDNPHKLSHIKSLEIAMRPLRETDSVFSIAFAPSNNMITTQRVNYTGTNLNGRLEVTNPLFNVTSGSPLVDETGAVVGTYAEKSSSSTSYYFLTNHAIWFLLRKLPISGKIITMDEKIRLGNITYINLQRMLNSNSISNIELIKWAFSVSKHPVNYASIYNDYLACNSGKENINRHQVLSCAILCSFIKRNIYSSFWLIDSIFSPIDTGIILRD